MVCHNREGRVNTAHAGFAKLEAKVQIGMRDRRVDLIKSSHGKKIGAPDGETRRRQRRDRAHGLREIGVVHRIARPLMQRRPHQSAHTGDQAGVLDSPRRVKQFRRDRTYLLVFQWLDKVLNPIPLSRFNVIVEKNNPFSPCRSCAGVAFCGEIERRIELQESNMTVDRFG